MMLLRTNRRFHLRMEFALRIFPALLATAFQTMAGFSLVDESADGCDKFDSAMTGGS